MGLCLKIENVKTGICYALKGVLEEIAKDEDLQRRFLKELKIWFAASSCDGVVEAHAFVRINGVLYVAAEWVHGGDLRARLPKMTAEERLRVAVEITDTLRVLHHKYRVIHRDLKPENILICSDGRALVSDLGLAKVQVGQRCTSASGKKDLHLAEAHKLTMAGTHLGTCYYMSPEQIVDSSGVDFRSDIYALGCIFFEMETGRSPFEGNDIVTILRGHLYESPERLGGLFKRTNLGIEKIIARCLEKQPGKRFLSYEELLEELLKVASKRFPELCYTKAGVRYERKIVGEGYSEFKDLLAGHTGENPYAVLDFRELHPIIEEALALSQMHRYEEALKIVGHFSIPEAIRKGMLWHLGCALVETQAHLLVLSGDSERALSLYELLDGCVGKPVEFYLNFSQALLNVSPSQDFRALEIVDQGLANSPEDLDLLGNQAIALLRLQRTEEALTSARKRYLLDSNSISAALTLSKALGEQAIRVFDFSLNQYRELLLERIDVLAKAYPLNSMRGDVLLEIVRCIYSVDKGKALIVLQKLMNDKRFSGVWSSVAKFDWAVGAKEFYGQHSAPENVIEKIITGIHVLLDAWRDRDDIPVFVRGRVSDVYNFLIRRYYKSSPDKQRYLLEYYQSAKIYNDSESCDALRCPVELARMYSDLGDLSRAVSTLESVPRQRKYDGSIWNMEIPYRNQNWY
ncbi:MAG: serine/threonine protein kinase, partial [Opitutales bacterium]|nr:serine/threonine protein kinase [Opitutales bacterium]